MCCICAHYTHRTCPPLLSVPFPHTYQVEIEAVGEAHFRAWEGWVESRLRTLIQRLQQLVVIRPWPKGLAPPGPPEVDADGNTVHRCCYYMGIRKKPQPPGAAGKVQVNLNTPVSEFRYQVMTWNDYKEGMDITVKHIKQTQLPEWVRCLDAPSSADAADAAGLEVPAPDMQPGKRAAEEQKQEGEENGDAKRRKTQDMVSLGGWRGVGVAFVHVSRTRPLHTHLLLLHTLHTHHDHHYCM